MIIIVLLILNTIQGSKRIIIENQLIDFPLFIKEGCSNI